MVISVENHRFGGGRITIIFERIASFWSGPASRLSSVGGPVGTCRSRVASGHCSTAAPTDSVGFLAGRMVMVVWTPRGDARHIISMRKCNAKEQARYRQRFAEG